MLTTDFIAITTITTTKWGANQAVVAEVEEDEDDDNEEDSN